jgi:hypothetical protein
LIVVKYKKIGYLIAADLIYPFNPKKVSYNIEKKSQLWMRLWAFKTGFQYLEVCL